MDDRWDRIAADIFTEILQRLPPSPRQRLRRVCRHWRSIIDDRTPATQARAMVVAFVIAHGHRRAYVLDDLTGLGAGERELKLPRGAADRGVSMVGACNGLLCLRRWRGDFAVLNPVTGEKLAVPPPSESPVVLCKEAAGYSFAYHPGTGLYKIVQVPLHKFGALKVFTLGYRSWREVRVPAGTSFLPSFGLASVDGATYWVADDTHTVMSLDLKDERVVFVATPLPVRVVPFMDLSWHLTTDLRGRLAFAVCSYEMMKRAGTVLVPVGIQIKVWMLEDGGRKEKPPVWVLRCKVREPLQEPPLSIARPHVIHGEHLLTTGARGDGRMSLHACRLSEARTHGGVVQTEGSPLIGQYDDCDSLQTFAYVETTEPLAFYGGGNDCDIGEHEEWDWRFDAGEQRWKLMPRTSNYYLRYDDMPIS